MTIATPSASLQSWLYFECPGSGISIRRVLKRKSASEWTEEEIERLLTKSPWAKEADAEMDSAGMSPTEGGGPGGGPGVPGRRSGPGAAFRIKALVRWESAAPIREASRRQFPSDPSRC